MAWSPASACWQSVRNICFGRCCGHMISSIHKVPAFSFTALYTGSHCNDGLIKTHFPEMQLFNTTKLYININTFILLFFCTYFQRDLFMIAWVFFFVYKNRNSISSLLDARFWNTPMSFFLPSFSILTGTLLSLNYAFLCNIWHAAFFFTSKIAINLMFLIKFVKWK